MSVIAEVAADELLDLPAIEARVAAATDGPWCLYQGDLWRGTAAALVAYDADPENAPWPYGEDTDFPANTGHLFNGDPIRVEDAEFIAHARTDVPALVAEVRRLRAGRDIEQDMLRNTAHRLTKARELVDEYAAGPRADAWRVLPLISEVLAGGEHS